MIISASRRTDLPALHAPWLRERFAQGHCRVANPYNAKQVRLVSLRREDVDAVVFWTRHARPSFDLIDELLATDYRLVVQYTITGYPRTVEARTPSPDVAAATLRDLARRLPNGAVVWRYDPILVGPAFSHESHMRRFRRVASALEGHVERVVVSVVDPYRKVRRRMGEQLAEDPLAWSGLDALLLDLVRVAGQHGLTVEACAEERDFTPLGIGPTKCVDDGLLGRLYGGRWSSAKHRGQRLACRCIPSVDIGTPDTCTFGCAYCYATR